ADVATPLAVVLAELLQNAVEHAFPTSDSEDPEAPGPAGRVDLALANDGYGLTIEVRDDGCGLPADFDIEKTSSLGLSIVRDLVTSQLGGMIGTASAGGTVVTIDIPLRDDEGPLRR
ncbi:MAG: ATP-binding protein, partial [Acidimicrobiales bacterium]